MKPQDSHQAGLTAFVDSLQAGGRYVFTREEALKALGTSSEALKKAARRLIERHRLAMPRRGFFVIVPLEYRSAGAPPPNWFIDALMKFHGHQYYVGLLTAAAIHGAAHQQPMEFQVVTNAQLRPTVVGRARVRFFTKPHLEATPTIELKNETGLVRTSTPEATALDLVRYLKGAGHLNHVATVLTELAEQMDPHRLVDAAKADPALPLSVVQRLGYLLELAGHAELVRPLAEWLAELHPRLVPLRSDRNSRGAETNPRWRIRINEQVEADL